MADTINLHDYIEATHPGILDELRRRRLLRRAPGPRRVERIMVDVTAAATASAVGEGATPGHAAYRREHGRQRQVRSA